MDPFKGPPPAVMFRLKTFRGSGKNPSCCSSDPKNPKAPCLRHRRLGCRFNHSCRPAVSYYFKLGAVLALRLLVPVPVGAELTLSYTSLLAPAAVRRAGLARRYCFHCACPRCAQEDDVARRGGPAVAGWWLGALRVGGAPRGGGGGGGRGASCYRP